MPERRGSTGAALTLRLLLGALALSTVAVVLPAGVGAVGAAGASDTASTGDAVGAARTASAQDDPSPTVSVPPETTSTLPSGGEVGNIVPRPNSGAEPRDSGDPGGSLQVGLFFGLCAALALMAGFVWWRSRVARAKRSAAGWDPVTAATERGGDVRKPRPPGIVD